MPSARAFFLDLEGTLVRDKHFDPIPGAVEWVRRFKERGRGMLVTSNNTTDSPGDLHRRLEAAGFPIGQTEVLTCAVAGIEILHEWGARSCYLVGEPSLARMITEAGIDVRDSSDVDAVVVGLDRSLTYGRLSGAVGALLAHKIPLLALHYNRLYLDTDGARGPSAGAIVRSLEYAAGVQAVVAGKPSRRFFDAALRIVGVSAGDVMMVSDDPFSDLLGARDAGMRTAFVLSGKYPSDDVLEQIDPARHPDLVVRSIVDIGEDA
jgi:4-nitrophenyl phosphatase